MAAGTGGLQDGGTRRSGVGERRAAGELEAAVLGVLWDAGEGLRPGEVRDRLAEREPAMGELSYSTVVTILGRLYAKRALVRDRDGRAFRYSPAADQAGLAARRLTEMLDGAPDRAAVLSRFVEDLSDRDEELLRGLLRDGQVDHGTGS